MEKMLNLKVAGWNLTGLPDDFSKHITHPEYLNRPDAFLLEKISRKMWTEKLDKYGCAEERTLIISEENLILLVQKIQKEKEEEKKNQTREALTERARQTGKRQHCKNKGTSWFDKNGELHIESVYITPDGKEKIESHQSTGL